MSHACFQSLSKIVTKMLTNDNPEVIDDILPMTFMSVTKMLEKNPLLPTTGLASLAGASLAKGTSHVDALRLIEMIAKQRCRAMRLCHCNDRSAEVPCDGTVSLQ